MGEEPMETNGIEEENKPEPTTTKNEESCRVKISNLPNYMKYAQLKKLVTSRLGDIAFRKLKSSPGVGYLSMFSLEDTLKAVELLNKFEFRGNQLNAKRVAEEPQSRAEPKKIDENALPKTANEISAPLFGIPYDEQIKLKQESAKKTATTLIKQLLDANVSNARYIKVDSLLQEIVRSPITTHYRNKCEFTIGLNADSEPCIGFVGGPMSNKVCTIVSADDSVLITENMRKIVEVFTNEIVKKHDLAIFDEFERTGVWKRLTIKDYAGDCMIIVTVHPFSDEAKITAVKEKILSTFLKFGNVTDQFDFNVRSVYWQVQENISDPIVYEHIGGTPFVYESILNVRFRISPYTFFQTNSLGASLLYSVIGDFLELPNVDRPNALSDSGSKESEQLANLSKSIYLLDICCGAGTIGQCLLRRIERAKQAGQFDGSYACIGVELIDQAVKDARRNAEENGFSKEKCLYISGEAEVVFHRLSSHFNIDSKDENSVYFGVLDPPRAGLSTKVIMSCRKLEKMRKLIYVSCDPKLAISNLVNLCRPESKRYDGTPFKIQKICPVDMFPQTNHCEWIVLLTR